MTPTLCSHPESYLINAEQRQYRCIRCGFQWNAEETRRRPNTYAIEEHAPDCGEWQVVETFPSRALALSALANLRHGTPTTHAYRVRRVPRFQTVYVVQAKYSAGWEDVTASLRWKEARADRRAYCENDHHQQGVRIITRREPNQAHPDHA